MLKHLPADIRTVVIKMAGILLAATNSIARKISVLPSNLRTFTVPSYALGGIIPRFRHGSNVGNDRRPGITVLSEHDVKLNTKRFSPSYDLRVSPRDDHFVLCLDSHNYRENIIMTNHWALPSVNIYSYAIFEMTVISSDKSNMIYKGGVVISVYAKFDGLTADKATFHVDVLRTSGSASPPIVLRKAVSTPGGEIRGDTTVSEFIPGQPDPGLM
jgi:hypothetical protein